MLDEFIFYLNFGIRHVLDWQAYDHILFLIVLTIFYTFKNWKNGLWLITAFTIGHTLSLSLSAYNLIGIPIRLIEFLIPVTIASTAIFNIITIQKPIQNIKITAFFSLFFGLIHGLGFSGYFKIIVDDYNNKLLPLIEFALGIEIAQIIIVICILFLNFIILNILNRSKRDWVLVVSSVVIGMVIPMLIERFFW